MYPITFVYFIKRAGIKSFHSLHIFSQGYSVLLKWVQINLSCNKRSSMQEFSQVVNYRFMQMNGWLALANDFFCLFYYSILL